MSTEPVFIQPDTATPATSANTGASANAASTAGNANSFFSFASFVNPKVDLSSSFKPFTNAAASAATGSNTRINERQYTGGDTLDEPVLTTLSRDLTQIAKRLFIVVWPVQLQSLASKQQQRFVQFAQQNGVNLPSQVFGHTGVSRSDVDEFEINDDEDDVEADGTDVQAALLKNNLEWDLWGPLIFSLLYSVSLGLRSSRSNVNDVFSGTFTFIWLFSLVIGLNIQLLGGNISFLSAISATGYSMFPIVVALLIGLIFHPRHLVKVIIVPIFYVWSVYLGVLSLKCSGVLPGRVFLASYPVALMYAILAWLCIVS